MLLHTVIAIDEIMLGADSKPNFEYKKIDGKVFMGENTESGFRIERMISTNPKDYLLMDYYPGKYLL